MYISDNWDDMFITISNDISKTGSSKHSTWSSSDGIIIALPASNRKEALMVANRIYSEYYKPLEIELMK